MFKFVNKIKHALISILISSRVRAEYDKELMIRLMMVVISIKYVDQREGGVLWLSSHFHVKYFAASKVLSALSMLPMRLKLMVKRNIIVLLAKERVE